MYSHIPPGAQPHCAPTLKYPLALFIQLHIVTCLCRGPSLPHRLPAHDALRQDWSRVSTTLHPKHPNTTPTHSPLTVHATCTIALSHKQTRIRIDTQASSTYPIHPDRMPPDALPGPSPRPPHVGGASPRGPLLFTLVCATCPGTPCTPTLS